MGISVRSRLVAGFTVIAVGVITVPPTAAVPAVAQVRAVEESATSRIELTASVADTVAMIVSNPPNPTHFAAAGSAMARIASSTSSLPGTTRVAALPPAPPVTLNAASDGIVAAYQAIQYWVNYGVQLSSYVLQFVPFGYQISSQINIFYYNLIRPIANSVVYGLIVPVVNDPLNPASYVNGLIAVGQASVNAAINTGIAEFNQFFGWLIPPLPPRPLVTTAVAKTPAAEVAAAKSVGSITDVPLEVVPPEPPATIPADITEPKVAAEAVPATATTSSQPAGESVPVNEAGDETVQVGTTTRKAPPKVLGTEKDTPAVGSDDGPISAAAHPGKKPTTSKQVKAAGTEKAKKTDGTDEKSRARREPGPSTATAATRAAQRPERGTQAAPPA